MTFLNFKSNRKPLGQEPKPTIVNPDKILSTIELEVKKYIETNGRNIAQSYTWDNTQEFDLNRFPPVSYFKNLYQSKLNYVGSIYAKNLSLYKSEYNKYLAKYGGNTVQQGEDVYAEIKDLEAECNTVMGEASMQHTEAVDSKKDKIKDLKQDIKDLYALLKSLPHHNLLLKKMLFVTIASAIALGEMLLNSDTFIYLGYSNFSSIFIGTSITLVTFMIGFGQANILKDTTKKFAEKLVASLGFIIAIVFLFFVLGTVRVHAMNSEENEGLINLSPFYFVAFSIAFYVGICVTKVFFAPTKKQIKENEAYNVAKNDVKSKEKKCGKLEKEVAQSYKVKDKKRNVVKQQYAKKAKPFKDGIKKENDTIRSSASSFNELLETSQNFYQEINSNYLSSVSSLINTINLSKTDKANPLLMSDVESLDNPFKGTALLDINPIPAIPLQSQGVRQTSTTSSEKPTTWEIHTQNNQSGDDINYSFNINPKKN